MPTKSFWSSKTNIFNILSTILTVLGALQGTVPPTALPWIVLVIGIINVVLRTFFTNMPIA